MRERLPFRFGKGSVLWKRSSGNQPSATRTGPTEGQSNPEKEVVGKNMDKEKRVMAPVDSLYFGTVSVISGTHPRERRRTT